MLELLLCAPTLLVSPQDPDLAEVNRLAREITARIEEVGGNTLTRMETLRALDAEVAAQGELLRQVVALHAMKHATELSNYAEALAFGDLTPPYSLPVSEELAIALEQSEPQDAVEAIVRLAEDEVLVLVNEAHHVPQHRALTLELLHALREQGFTHFAAETISDKDTELAERGYPSSATGAYVDEPLCADLVRTALALGYEIVAYESLGADRELGQATNLLARTLEIDEHARVLVHAGYAHINETGEVAGSRAMAGRVKEITGIDPLTIDQTLMTEHSERRLEHPLYRRILEDLELERPTIFVGEKGRAWTAEPGVRDVTVFSPRSVLEHGRPTWLRMNGLRGPFLLPDDVLQGNDAVQVEVWPEQEPDGAVPIDRVEVRAGDGPKALMLASGRYRMEVRSVEDEVLSRTTIELP